MNLSISAQKILKTIIAISTGTGIQDSEKLAAIFNFNPHLKFICIDVANGYSEHFVNFVKKTREQYPDKVIIAGNVVTGEMVEELLLQEPILIKVGIGPGSVLYNSSKNRCWLSTIISNY